MYLGGVTVTSYLGSTEKKHQQIAQWFKRITNKHMSCLKHGKWCVEPGVYLKAQLISVKEKQLYVLSQFKIETSILIVSENTQSVTWWYQQ